MSAIAQQQIWVLNGVQFTDRAEYERAKTLAIIYDLKQQLEEVEQLPERIRETAAERIQDALRALEGVGQEGAA